MNGLEAVLLHFLSLEDVRIPASLWRVSGSFFDVDQKHRWSTIQNILQLQQEIYNYLSFISELENMDVPASHRLDGQQAFRMECVHQLTGVGVAGHVPVDLRLEAKRMVVHVEQDVDAVG